VSGLVALAPVVDTPGLVETATDLGDHLIARAHASEQGWSWSWHGAALDHLTGFAHGAAGIGLALLELFAVTGMDRFREAADRAFAYERSWFDPDALTWPDLRGVARGARRSAPVPAADSWCHGAAGIALARIRAAQLLATPTSRAHADVALSAVRRAVRDLLAYAGDDFSLCHGAAGAGDVLLYGADSSDGPRETTRDLAARLGALGVERHHARAAAFPGGVPGGGTPALFLGQAGIALFYLRLADPRVPTPLVIHRDGAGLTPASSAPYSRSAARLESRR
jgi:lantibiotic biosynthesis protein